MKKRKKVIGVSLAILTTLIALVYGLKYTPVFAESKISATGKLEAPTIIVTAQVSGAVKSVSLNEGEVVTVNQTLAELQNLDLENSVFKAEAELEVANARLKQVNAGIKPEEKAVLQAEVDGQQKVVDSIQKALTESKLALTKLRSMNGKVQGSIAEHIDHLDKLIKEHSAHQSDPTHVHEPQNDGQMGMDCAQLLAQLSTIQQALGQLNHAVTGTEKVQLGIEGAALETQIAILNSSIGNLEANLSQAQKDLAVSKAKLSAADSGGRPEDIDMAHAQVKEAQVSLELAKKQLVQGSITSPVNGLILQKSINIQQYLNPGTTAFQLADLDNVWTEVQLAQIPSDLQVGSRVRAVAKEVPNKEFVCRVISITPAKEGPGSLVKIAVDNSENLLRPNMYASVFFDKQ
jgi:HlyD family secretion protein